MNNDPPFTVTRYGSLGAAICAERDWLRTRAEDLESKAVAQALRIRQLEAALDEAIEEIEHWGGYADNYFKEKHDLEGGVARLRSTLMGSSSDG